MKQQIFTLCFLLSLGFAARAQDGVTMKIQYAPQTKYSQSTEHLSKMEMKQTGSEEFLKRLAEKNVPNPLIINTEMVVETVFKTGAKAPDGIIPMTIEFIRTTSSNGTKPIPDGTRIYGRVSQGKLPQLDSIVSAGLNDSFKETLLKGMQSTFAQFNFPEKHVKIGESFTVESPLTMPIGGITIELNTNITYKLMSITNGIADFDISQTYAMKSAMPNADMKATGSGKGKLSYDVKNNFNVRLQMDVDMAMDMKREAFGMEVKSKSGFTQTTVISSVN